MAVRDDERLGGRTGPAIGLFRYQLIREAADQSCR